MKALFILPIAFLSFYLTRAQAPLNDNCTGLFNLGEVPFCSQAAQFTNQNATTSLIDLSNNVPSCWKNLADRDVWFQFNLPVNGSLSDISIHVLGNIAGNGTLNMPEIAVYRGDCVLGGLIELDCATSPLNVNEVHLDLFGLTPGAPYFVRVHDYSATPNPNAGTFKLCIVPYVQDLNMGDAAGTSSCSGTLWDSGGPDGAYQSNTDQTFVICPSEVHQCILLDFVQYATEFEYDYIEIYEGDDIGGALIQKLDGYGANLTLQLSSDCVTIRFKSDGSIQEEGFQMNWQCTPEVCDTPPPMLDPNATCDQALNINGCGNGPQIIPLSPGKGDPGFLQDGINQGCFLLPLLNFNQAFFYFQAEADGKFGFAVQPADPTTPSDIDFNVWGPISDVADICNFVSTHQPIRSSWDDGADLTGLADVHPITGDPVNDNFDCGSPLSPGPDPPSGQDSDDFVRRLTVQTGQIYVILLDDYDGQIQTGGMAIDFSGTTDGVLGPLSPPITLTPDTFTCNNSPIQLEISGGTSFAWSPSTGLSCNTCPNPIATPSETTTYEVAVLGVCQNFKGTVTVSVGPNLNVQHDTAICNGQSVLLGLNPPQAGVTYTWTPNDGSLSDPNIANPIATPLQTTVYTLTASSGPCTVTETVTVAVVNLNLNLSVQDSSICKGQSVIITATTSPSNIPINWSPLTQLLVQPGGNLVTATPGSSIVYQATATLPGCIRKENVAFTVDSLPINLSLSPSDTLICGGQQVLLVSPAYSGAHFPGLDFIWQTGSGQTLPDDAYFLLASPTTSTVYQRITSNGACKDTASANISVIPVPLLTITPANPQLCFGESTPLLVNNTGGLSNLQWSPPIGLSCVVCNNPTAAPSSSTNYTFTADVSNGCSVSAQVFVEVNQAPQFQFPNDTLCAGESILLNQIADTTASYSWTANPPGFTSTEAQPLVTPSQTTTYLVTIENGCTVQEQFKVTVIPPGNLMLSDNDTICAGVATQLTASGNYPGEYIWSNGATGQVISVAPNQTSTYFLTYGYPLPQVQCQIVDSVTLTVQGAVAQVQFPLDTLLCPGDSLKLNTLATPGGAYSWTSTPPGFSSSDAIPPVLYPEASTMYTVTTTLGNCSAIYAVDITVFNPEMTVSEDTTICGGEAVTIGAEALLTGQYFWTPGGNTATFEDTLSVDGQYTLRFEYGEGCIYRDTVMVDVIPNFTLKLVTDPDTNQINLGEPILLDAFVPGTNVSNFDFEWTENNLNLVGNTQQITVTPVTTDSSVTYLVTVTAPSGCVQTASVTFAVIIPNIKIPNAFTPNGDGANDSFGLAIVEGVAFVEKMEIYNRWGQKVYASNDPKARWDGTVDGKEASSDVYVYIIFYRGGDGALKVETGELTLLR